MRYYLLLSLFAHALFLLASFVWNVHSRHWTKFQDFTEMEFLIPKVTEQEAAQSQSQPQESQPIEKDIVNIKEIAPKPVARHEVPQAVKKIKPEPEKENPFPIEEATNKLHVEVKDFPFSYYLNLLRNRIKSNWFPPHQANENNSPLSVNISFEISRNGHIENIASDNSSGRYLFDQAALRAVYSVGTLPPLPEEFVGDRLIVHIEFEATR
jgi:TonB family protein